MKEWNIGGMMIDSGNPQREICPSATLFIKNLTWTALRLYPRLHGENLVTNCLRCAKINII
jgi:hypothetical protein